jgi:hypothetical protein
MTIRSRTAAAVGTFLALWGATPASGQLASERLRVPTPGVAEAARAAPGALRIDGRLDDPAWATAVPITQFVQREPDEGAPPSEPTEVRVVYTDRALYVAIRAFDSRAGEIAGHLTRRDEDSPSDWVGIMIDSYRDRRTAFEFAVNAAGVKRDIYRFNDTNSDLGWDAVWDVAVTSDAAGWVAEFEIPFTQLRFAEAGSHRFGFNIYRRINRLNELQYWTLLPREASGVVSLFGELVGIEGIEPPRRLEILPYAVARGTSTPAVDGDPFETGSERFGTMGADIRYGLSSNLTLSATINPDFGQVEADPAVVNLTAFETFLPEKRPHFQEGLDIFQFNIGLGDGGSQEQLFYTRRIGRSPQGAADPRGGHAEQIAQTTILGAAKVSGKTPAGWTIGLGGALTAEESATAIDSIGSRHSDVVEPMTGYFVGRLARDFRGGLSRIGVFGTAVQRDLPDNLGFLRSSAYTVAVDGSHRFRNDTYSIDGWIGTSHVRGSTDAIFETQTSSARYFQRPDASHVTLDPTRTSLSGFAGQLNIGKHSGGNWRWSAGVDTRSPGFEANDMGFMRNADRTIQYTWLQRRWLEPGRIFRRANVNFNQWAAWSHGWERLAIGGNLNGSFTLANYWSGFLGVNRELERLSPGTLRGGPGLLVPGGWNGFAGFDSDGRRTLRAGAFGSIYREDEGRGWSYGFHPEVSWRPASRLDLALRPGFRWAANDRQYLTTAPVDGESAYLLGELRQTTASLTFRGNVTFTPALSLQLYAEPFVSSGHYETFKQVTAPRASTYGNRFDVFGPDRVTTSEKGEVLIDVNGDGSVDANLGQPDFTFLSFRSNAVLRWEYRPGSALFVVWQHGRADETNDGRFEPGQNWGRLLDAPATNTFLIKLNYWFSL